MCRNIKTLFNFDPPATDDEVRAASLQFVRKISGTTKPSRANEAAFDRAVDDVTRIARSLLDSMVTTSPPRDRDVEAAKAKERARQRFGVPSPGAPAARQLTERSSRRDESLRRVAPDSQPRRREPSA
jgi:hypothetical protein